MPEINFQIQWPDGTEQSCYSPSLVVKQYFSPGETYELQEFVAKSRTALTIASDRVKEAYGFSCSRALEQFKTDRIQGSRISELNHAESSIYRF